MKKCGCNPIPEKFEFPILDEGTDNSSIDVGSLIEDYCPSCGKDTICDLKKKIINDFYHILKLLECGILPDLEFLLQEISLVYISNDTTILFK